MSVAWFAVYSTTLSQLMRMRVMATPYIFLFKQKILTFVTKKKTNLNIAATQNL